MMLADISGLETAGIIGGFVFGGLGLIISVWMGNKKQEVKVEQPVQTQKVWPSATVRDLESSQAEVQRRLAQHDQEISALRELIRIELPAMERRLMAENETRAVTLHNRINEILEAVSELRGKVES